MTVNFWPMHGGRKALDGDTIYDTLRYVALRYVTSPDMSIWSFFSADSITFDTSSSIKYRSHFDGCSRNVVGYVKLAAIVASTKKMSSCSQEHAHPCNRQRKTGGNVHLCSTVNLQFSLPHSGLTLQLQPLRLL